MSAGGDAGRRWTGDAELLTIKAVRALQAADVIQFDGLVSADALELARRAEIGRRDERRRRDCGIAASIHSSRYRARY